MAVRLQRSILKLIPHKGLSSHNSKQLLLLCAKPGLSLGTSSRFRVCTNSLHRLAFLHLFYNLTTASSTFISLPNLRAPAAQIFKHLQQQSSKSHPPKLSQSLFNSIARSSPTMSSHQPPDLRGMIAFSSGSWKMFKTKVKLFARFYEQLAPVGCIDIIMQLEFFTVELTDDNTLRQINFNDPAEITKPIYRSILVAATGKTAEQLGWTTQVSIIPMSVLSIDRIFANYRVVSKPKLSPARTLQDVRLQSCNLLRVVQ